MLRCQSTRKCRASLTCYSLLRPCNRTKSSTAREEKSHRFERDSAPHEGLPPLSGSPPPRAMTSRPYTRSREPLVKERPLHGKRFSFPDKQFPFVKERDRNEPQSSQQQQAAHWSPPISSTRPALTTPVHRQITIDDFFHPPQSVSAPADARRTSKSSDDELPSQFTSPPLLPALQHSLMETLGPFAYPTPIQSLSLKWILQESHEPPTEEQNWRQFFLASETGSGKSIAYLLPLLQSTKLAELAGKDNHRSQSHSKRLYNPRALILAPTHELSRQLSGFAKSLSHELKLRVLCASQSNSKSTKTKHRTSRKMVEMLDDVEGVGEFNVSKKHEHGVDVLVGTPMKLLEMVRGRGWDKRREEEMEEENDKDDEEAEEDTEMKKHRRGRDFSVGLGRKKTAELGLENVEWVIIDEADVLLDPDFQETTRLLLNDISAGRGHPIPLTSVPELEGSPQAVFSPPATPISYPFNLIFTSATIPNSLNNYLQNYHPSLTRLSSPDLHHLPKALALEYVAWSGNNKFADIHRRIREIWAEDAASSPDKNGELSKVLIFCNKSTKVIELSEYLGEHGVDCMPMTSESRHRMMGSNRHLFGFLKKPSIVDTASKKKALKSLRLQVAKKTETNPPLVMVTTSLLSRGLDFSPDVKHVFIVDEPRNMIDFLHRAGRAGRAGQSGKVIVFGKLSGRGSDKGREVRKKVVAFTARPNLNLRPKYNGPLRSTLKKLAKVKQSREVG